MANSDPPWTWGNSTIFAGITKLSQLGIDIDKDWLGDRIIDLGDPVDSQDAATKHYADSLPAASFQASLVDQTSNRSLSDNTHNHVYQNNSGRNLLVIICGESYFSQWAQQAIGLASLIWHIGAASPPSDIDGRGLGVELHYDFTAMGTPAIITQHNYGSFSFLVPPGDYYEITQDNSSYGGSTVVNYIERWLEIEMYNA